MLEINNKKSPLVLALDIGTTKVCALAGFRNEFGKIEITGIGKVKSEGVSKGVVSNIDKTVKAIKEAVSIAEINCGKKFENVNVGIAGQHIKSLQHHGLLVRKDINSEIDENDINRLIEDMYKLVLPPGDKILHVIPQEFTVDNEENITDPIGMSGVRLEANFHIITGQVSASKNIFKVVEKADLKVGDLTLEPIASATSVLTEEEKEAGVALIDIGGGTTDVTIFKDGIIRHTAVIPFGGNVVTSDIQEGLSVMKDQAEKLKVKFGSALAEEIVDNRLIVIPGYRGKEVKEISEKNLSRIIQARMEEILDFISWEISRSGYQNKLLAGIVLTGGGSLLKDIDLLAELHTGMISRLGEPTEHLAHGYNGDLTSPIYSTGIGLLIHAINQGKFEDEEQIAEAENSKMEFEFEIAGMDSNNQEKSGSKPGWLNKIFSYTKEFFESTPESEF
jgi:cell division protein FtsA